MVKLLVSLSLDFGQGAQSEFVGNARLSYFTPRRVLPCAPGPVVGGVAPPPGGRRPACCVVVLCGVIARMQGHGSVAAFAQELLPFRSAQA